MLKGGKAQANVPFDHSEAKVAKIINDLGGVQGKGWKASRSPAVINASAEMRGYQQEDARAAVAKAKRNPWVHDPSAEGRVRQFASRVPAGLAGKLKASHAADPLAGMVGFSAPYSAKGKGQIAVAIVDALPVIVQFTGYRTWRRITSTASGGDPSKWHIKATTGAHVATKMEKDDDVRSVQNTWATHYADKLTQLVKQFQP